MLSIVYGPKWPFYSCDDILDCLGHVLCRFCIWVELPVQMRLCPIFVKNVGSPDIHEPSGSQRTSGTPGIWGVTLRMGTGFREFPQTPRGRGFSLRGFYSSVKYHVNVSVD